MTIPLDVTLTLALRETQLDSRQQNEFMTDLQKDMSKMDEVHQVDLALLPDETSADMDASTGGGPPKSIEKSLHSLFTSLGDGAVIGVLIAHLHGIDFTSVFKYLLDRLPNKSIELELVYKEQQVKLKARSMKELTALLDEAKSFINALQDDNTAVNTKEEAVETS